MCVAEVGLPSISNIACTAVQSAGSVVGTVRRWKRLFPYSRCSTCCRHQLSDAVVCSRLATAFSVTPAVNHVPWPGHPSCLEPKPAAPLVSAPASDVLDVSRRQLCLNPCAPLHQVAARQGPAAALLHTKHRQPGAPGESGGRGCCDTCVHGLHVQGLFPMFIDRLCGSGSERTH